MTSSSSLKTLFIVNPASANGSTGKNWPKMEGQIRQSFRGAFDVAFTEEREHAVLLARRGIKGGYHLVVALGGDGTVNEVVNGFFEDGSVVDPDATLGVISVGTGSDFVKTLGMEKGVAAGVKALNEGRVRTVDVGLASFRAFSGQDTSRYFINIADFGSGGAVSDKVNRTSKALGGRISFLWAILTTLPTYKNKRIRYRIDGGEAAEEVLNNFVVANGKFFGGGLKPAPLAELDDGLFDIIFFGDISFRDVLTNLRKLAKGTHLEHPKVRMLRGREVEASSEEQVLVEMEGEVVGTLPASFELLPQALRIRA